MKHEFKHGSPLAPLFKNGTVLWRSVAHYSGMSGMVGMPTGLRRYVTPRETTFEKTDKGSFAGRVHLEGGTGDFIWEPVVSSARTEEGRPIYGLVVFVDKEPEPNWTHLIVKGVSKAMQQPYDREAGYRRVKGGGYFCDPG